MAKIELDRVGKRFPDGTETLKSVSFTIRDGEFFILVGPSGCGKSTLLNLIVGLEEASAGEIRVDGRIVNHLDPKDRNMAMVFQSYAIYPHMSVRDNIAFPLRLAKLPKAVIDRRVAEAAAILELTPLLERKPASLSGGQRQRVAMGRAIVREPQVFLLDEPLSNLDARLRVQMRSEIAGLQKRHHHDLCDARSNRSDDARRPGRSHEPRRSAADRYAAGALPSSGQSVRGRLHRLAGHESAAGGRRRIEIAFTDREIALPENDPARRPKAGAYVVAGIRPEHFRPAGIASSSPETLVWDALAERIEWLGSELYVYCQARFPAEWRANWPEELQGRLAGDGTVPLIARLDPSTPVRQGEKFSLQCDRRNIQLFDIETTRNLSLA